MAVNSFSSLPDEMVVNIFEFLKPKDLLRCTGVDVRFRSIALEILTKLEIQNLSDLPESACITSRVNYFNNIDSWDGVKRFLRGREVYSYEEVLLRLQQFLTRLPIGHSGEFRCFFPCNLPTADNHGLYVEIRGLNPKYTGEGEYCVFLRKINRKNENKDSTAFSCSRLVVPGKFLNYTNIILPFESKEFAKGFEEKVKQIVSSRMLVLEQESNKILNKIKIAFGSYFSY
ncbi:MAG: F-box protein [Candidatus Melainabacteria bacterium]|nr:F-box protein [Candidatus Melainabacteria bacterium]